MLAVKKTYADAGITLDNLRHFSGGAGQKDLNAILLDQPERPQAIENMKTWIRNVGKAGFYYTGGTLSITGGWRSGMSDTRGAPVPEFDENSPDVHAGYGASNPSKLRDMLLFAANTPMMRFSIIFTNTSAARSCPFWSRRASP